MTTWEGAVSETCDQQFLGDGLPCVLDRQHAGDHQDVLKQTWSKWPGWPRDFRPRDSVAAPHDFDPRLDLPDRCRVCRQHRDDSSQHPYPAPAGDDELRDAERWVRRMLERGRVPAADHSLPIVVSEYDRRGAVERAAADYIRAGLCGLYETHPAEYQAKYTALVAALRTNRNFDA